MIIHDEDDPDKVKDPPVDTPTIRYPERAAGRPFSHLPDYETSQALTLATFNDSQVTLYKPPRRRRIIDSRFWRAAIGSLAVYIFLTIIIGVPIILHKEQETQQKYVYPALNYAVPWPDKDSDTYSTGTRNISSPVQSGVIPVCNDWDNAEVRTDLTVLAWSERQVSPNGQFSITSNASFSVDFNLVQGAFYAGINPNQTAQDAVLSVLMQSPSLSVFNRIFVCTAIANNFTDLILYIPDNLTQTDDILFNVTLLFPQTATPSQVDSFATFLPMFDQHFGSLDPYVTFSKVTIEGPVSRVTADSIQARSLLIDTSLEPVVGSFSATDSLLISTIMAPINANITLYNDPQSNFPTILDIHTGNSNLTANITVLAPNKEPPSRPNFIADLRTFYGSLSANLTHDPTSPPTAIRLHVDNDVGPVDVAVDSLFEGLFQATTKQAAVTVTQGNNSVPDPWLPGAARAIDYNENATARAYGWIGWGQRPTTGSSYQQGEVIVGTSLANATLSFSG